MTALFSARWTALFFRVVLAPAMLAAGCVSPVAGVTSHTREQCPEVLTSALPRLREGDVIFIRMKNAIYRKIAETSQSWESHVGILFRDSRGAWTVAESTLPITKFTPLEKLVMNSKNGRFVIRRLRAGLSPEETQCLRVAVQSRMGKLYHLGFKYDSPRLYCSKFVYDTFLEATGHRIGRIETFREMIEKNPAAPVGFWRFWFFGCIPWERRCVTTTTQLLSPELVTVFDSENRTK